MKYLDYPICLKLKELGIDQTLKYGDWYYRDIGEGIESKSHESTNDFKIPNDYFIKCKIPTEQDVRDFMTVEEWEDWIEYLSDQLHDLDNGNMDIEAMNIETQKQKSNYLQLMVDWIIKKRGK